MAHIGVDGNYHDETGDLDPAYEHEHLEERHEQELQRIALGVWLSSAHRDRSVLRRLADLATLAERVRVRGPLETSERELQVDLLLHEWGEAYLMKMLALAASGQLG